MNDLEQSRVPTRWWYWWPVLIGPVAILCIFFLTPDDYVRRSWKPALEVAAIALTIAALAAGLTRFASRRLEYHLLLAMLAMTVLFREIHWNWMDKGVYIMVAILGAWGWFRRREMDTFLDPNPMARVWLIATGCTYVLSQAIARRALRGIDAALGGVLQEDRFYDDMEEVLECLSHLMLLVTIIVDSRRPLAPRRTK